MRPIHTKMLLELCYGQKLSDRDEAKVLENAENNWFLIDNFGLVFFDCDVTLHNINDGCLTFDISGE